MSVFAKIETKEGQEFIKRYRRTDTRRGIRRSISILTAMAIMLQNSVITTIAQESTKNITVEDVTLREDILDEEPVQICEIEENRGEFVKEYLLSDYSKEMIVYSQPVHYELEDGSFAEIDNSLIKTEDGYENADNSYKVVITDNEDSQGEVIYQEGDYEISWQMVELSDKNGEEDNTSNDVNVEVSDIVQSDSEGQDIHQVK